MTATTTPPATPPAAPPLETALLETLAQLPSAQQQAVLYFAQFLASQLRPLLPELIGDAAPTLQTQLEPLLQALPSPENQVHILALLQPHPAAADWLDQQTQMKVGAAPQLPTMSPMGADRGYSPLAGDRAIDSEPEIRYICPKDGCQEDYFTQSSREAAPLCEKHGVVMVREAECGEGESRIV